MASLDIVQLIENNPIMKLSGTYNSKLLEKIKITFNGTEQQLFVASFFCYLNYNNKTDFVIDLDNIWKWIGFSQKVRAKELLEKKFVVEKDYKKSLSLERKQYGNNKETILMNIKTFKLFCLKAGTKKADQIHEYYINLEEALQEVIQEETNELKLQLEQKDIQLEQNKKQIESSSIEKELLKEKTILEQFPKNTQCVYYGLIDDTNTNSEKFIKFGNSNNLVDRVKAHKHNFTNFRLVKAFKVDNKLHVENCMKTNTILCQKRRSMIINCVNQTELLVLDDMTHDTLNILIKDIIKSIEYSPENYVKLMEEHTKLKKKYAILLHRNDINDNILPTVVSITSLREIMLLPETDKKKNNVRKYQKLPDKLYHIDGKTYPILSGTREQVFNEEAYRTNGMLIKSDLTIGGKGGNRIVSLNKFISSKLDDRLNRNRNKDQESKCD
jgi:MSV199 domain